MIITVIKKMLWKTHKILIIHKRDLSMSGKCQNPRRTLKEVRGPDMPEEKFNQTTYLKNSNSRKKGSWAESKRDNTCKSQKHDKK